MVARRADDRDPATSDIERSVTHEDGRSNLPPHSGSLFSSWRSPSACGKKPHACVRRVATPTAVQRLWRALRASAMSRSHRWLSFLGSLAASPNDRRSPFTHAGSRSPHVWLRRAGPQTTSGARGPLTEPGSPARAGARVTCVFARRLWVHRGLPPAAHRGLAPVQAHDLALEGPTLDGELLDIEVTSVAEHREDDATEPVGHRHHRHLVATPRASGAKYGWRRWSGRLAWGAASQSIARSSAAPRFVIRPCASRSPD